MIAIEACFRRAWCSSSRQARGPTTKERVVATWKSSKLGPFLPKFEQFLPNAYPWFLGRRRTHG